MSRRYQCGLLYLSNNRRPRKVPLHKGGGPRTCEWFSQSITFDEVHQHLLNIFKLNKQREKTSLYDYCRRPLKVHEYRTLSDYLEKHSFSGGTMVLYLGYCNDESGTVPDPPIPPAKENPVPTMATIEISDSSSETTTTKKDDDLRTIFLRNPYKHLIEDLVDDVCSFLTRMNFHPVLFQLFENICRIASSIDLYTELFQNTSGPPLGPAQEPFLLLSFTSVADRFQSTSSLLQSNELTFGHLREYAMIKNKFTRVQVDFQRLCQPQMDPVVSIPQLTSTLVRLLDVFREYQMPFYEINQSLIEQLSGQHSTLDPQFLIHVQNLIRSVRQRCTQMYSIGDLHRSVYQTITELFETISPGNQ